MKFLKANCFIFIICLLLFTSCKEAGRIIDKVITTIQNATPVLIIILCFAGIVFVMWTSLFKISNHQAAIVVSSVLCCIIMVPMVVSFSHYIQRMVKHTILNEEEEKITALRNEFKVKTLEQQKLENEVKLARQSIEIENLNKKNILLERARLQMQGFKQIAELALTQANFKYTLVKKEPTTDITDGWKIKADYYHDEVLVVSTYDINAKFGIDLREVKITKTDNNSVIVSGIRPKFIGTDKWERDNLIKEIRRVDYKYGEWYRTRILDARQNGNLADIKEQQFDQDFNKRVREGMELAFMDEVIIQLAQNFIKIVLAPIYDQIIFDNTDRPYALNLMDFLVNELDVNDEEKSRLLKINEQIAMEISLFDTEQNASEEEEQLNID